jgi:hypothetical protein
MELMGVVAVRQLQCHNKNKKSRVHEHSLSNIWCNKHAWGTKVEFTFDFLLRICRKKDRFLVQTTMVANPKTTMYSHPRTKAERRFNVLTKAADIQKRRAIYQRKTVWFPLKPVSAVVEPVEMDDEEDSTTDDEDTTTRTGPPPASREVCPLVHAGSRRASRRFNVLTKASVAKARMGKPGHGAKTGWFPLNTASSVVIFSLPDERSSLAEHTGVHR